MGRRKKAAKRRDARGYQQMSSSLTTSPNNNSKDKGTTTITASLSSASLSSLKKIQTVEITSSTHQRLEDLLESLQEGESDKATTTSTIQQQTPTTTTIALPSDRFAKRISSIYDRLVALKFDFEQIEKAVVALKYDITLTTALDWLCLNLPTLELPPLFTEGQVRNDAIMAGGASNNNNNNNSKGDPLTVLVAAPPCKKQLDGDNNKQQANNLLLVDTARMPATGVAAAVDSTTATAQEDDEGVTAEQKAWMLEQYQYVAEEDDKLDSNHCNDSLDQKVDKADDNPPNEVLLSTDELCLQQVKEELRQTKEDLNDEASNYMRSKFEIKELQRKAKQLQKQVAQLERKVERQRQANDKAAATTNENDEQGFSAEEPNEKEGEEGGIFSSMFDEEQIPEEPRVVCEKDVVHAPPTMSIPEIPKDWTGSTPKDILEEWCRKQKITTKPSFKRLPLNGCKLSIKFTAGISDSDPPVIVEQQGPLSSFVAAEQYVATKALYQINSELPLYRILPPWYRDLWMNWLDIDRKAQDDLEQEEKDRRQEKIDQLIRSIEETGQASSEPSVRQRLEPEEKEESDNDEILDSWDDVEDQGSTLGSPTKKGPGSPAENERLTEDFRRRQESSKYKAMAEERSKLPIFSFRDRILETVRNNAVTVLCAETGAGKTTQCPQFLLEEALLTGRGSCTSIICTQPRRVAATTVAERVADEMCDRIGRQIGYQIRLESRRSADTKLLFCTTGVILRRLVEDPALKHVTHVIVDEVHERQWEIDVLLTSLRKMLTGVRPDLKVILMSATLDAELFRSFFGKAPLVSVPGRTYPVANYYLEDLFEATDHVIEEGSYCARWEYSSRETTSLWVTTKGGEKRKETVSLDLELDVDVSENFVGYKLSTRRSMDRVDESVINYDLVEDVLQLILIDTESNSTLVPPEGADLSKGSVLIFLPGIGEIRTLLERLQSSRLFGKEHQFDLIPMHSSLSTREQQRAFRAPRRGCRKIILSTNIAETSITIPDVVFVIDCGRVRELQNDKRTSTPKLVATWCSRTSAKQRAGRAGRVQPGLCLKLFSSRTERYTMKERSEPELRRIPLEEVCLSILAAGFATSCKQFLSQTPQPPAENAVTVALNVLHEVGAVSFIESNAEETKTQGVLGRETLTPLGRHLAKLPVDVRLGKMLIFGALFRCIDPIATIAACLSASKSPFASSLTDNAQARAAYASFRNPQSDFLTLKNVYDFFRESETAGRARKFCRDNYLNLNSLREISDSRQLYLDLLCGIGFLDRNQSGYEHSRGRRSFNDRLLSSGPFNSNGKRDEVVHCVVFSGVYPNIAQLVLKPGGASVLKQKSETLFIHSSSVNSKPSSRTQAFLAFHEKFGTANRVSVSTTCFVDPISIMLFASSLAIKHVDRIVCIDEWIELRMAPKTGLMFRELRKQVDYILKAVIEQIGTGKESLVLDSTKVSKVVDGIVGLLRSTAE